MKYIRNISDEQNKVGDTDNVFRLNLFEDDKLFDFGENNLTVNIANSSGYIVSLTPKKETGNTVIDLDFNDAPLKNLTPDDYLLEVEVKFPDGTTATFPTKGGMPFTVNSNLKNTAGHLVPTVTFDNVLAAVDEKIAVYMDTVKVGPQGPKGDMDLSQITVGGRNLLLNTIRSFTGVGDNSANGGFNAQGGEYYLAGGKKVSDLYKQYGKSGYLTISFDWVASGDVISGEFNPQWNDTPWNSISNGVTVKPSATNKSGHYESTVSLTGDYSTSSATGVRFKQAYLQGNITVSNLKLEAGNIATDCTPAPEDVPSNDAQLVHKTGTETIPGDKAFTGNNSFSGPTTLKTGNYGLRITTSGIQKTSDGGTTWTNI